MHISKNIVPSYNYEVASLTYNITLSKEVSVSVDNADLICFIKKYCPEINIDNYIPIIERFKKTSISYHTSNKIKYLYDPMLEEYFSGFDFQDLDFKFDDDFDKKLFEDMKASDNLNLFFSLSDKVIDYIKSLNTTLISKKNNWEFFDDYAICVGDFYELKVDRNFINDLSIRVTNDFNSFSLDMVDIILKKEEEDYKRCVPFDMFINNFSNDIATLKSQDVDYSDFIIFLHKYKLPNQDF